MATAALTSWVSRGQYGEISGYPEWVRTLLSDCEAAGAWTSGIESDKRHRGTSINVDVYSYDDSRGLAVVQVRECAFRPGRFNRVRKDYFLCGRNENGNAFAHPVPSVARSSRALGSAEGGVLRSLAWIWGCAEDEVDEIVRNGDVAFVPVASAPAEAVELPGTIEIVLAGSHRLSGQILLAVGDKGGRTYYVRRQAKLEHVKRQHRTARIRGGYYRVAVGHRATTWSFSAPTAD